MNKEIEKIVIEGSTTKKTGCYQKFICKQKLYNRELHIDQWHKCRYVGEFSGLNTLQFVTGEKAISAHQQKEHKAVTELYGKKKMATNTS